MSALTGRWPGSIRFRLTALATVAVAVVLVATAVALVTIQRRQLTANLDGSLEQRADSLAADYAIAVPPTPVNTNDEDRAIQLVAADGRILAATANLAGVEPLPVPLTGDQTQAVWTLRDLPLEDDRYRALARRIDTAEGPALLHVLENSDDLDEALRNLTAALAVGVPGVVALLAAVMWWLTGRTLEPVERIRAEVDAISTTNSGLRIHDPPRDDEIGRLARTMNRMLDRLTEAGERQRRFVADAAHELRTPLTRIRTDVEVDLAQPERADPGATNRAVRDEVDDLQRLIDDLLHLARSDAGRAGGEHRPVDLDDLVMEEIGRARSVADGKAIDATGVSAAHVTGDAGHLGRAIRNLLDNAVAHATSAVTVTLSEGPTGVLLTVADDGPGVAPENQARIFERFSRIDDARARTNGGTGLGLAITRDIVERHGGTVAYDDDETVGARFVVTLPTADDRSRASG